MEHMTQFEMMIFTASYVAARERQFPYTIPSALSLAASEVAALRDHRRGNQYPGVTGSVNDIIMDAFAHLAAEKV